jgi:hypothetical protein
MCLSPEVDVVRIARTLIFLAISIALGVGGVISLSSVPGLVTLEKTQVKNTQQAVGSARSSAGEKAARAGTPAKGKTNAPAKPAPKKGADKVNEEAANPVEAELKKEESVRFRIEMKTLVETLDRLRKKIGL